MHGVQALVFFSFLSQLVREKGRKSGCDVGEICKEACVCERG